MTNHGGKDNDFDFQVVDDLILIVDNSEVISKSRFIYDSLQIQFPDCPPKVAVCITVGAILDYTFVEYLTNTSQ